MRLVIHIPRRKPEFPMSWAALAQGYVTVASSHEQAERFFIATKTLLNGRDPQAESG
jgi:hypothetical protein